MTTRDTITAYFAAIATNDPHAAQPFLHDDVKLVEHPNVLNPKGKTYDRTAMREAGERGAKLMASQSYDIREMIIDGERAAVTTVWTGTLRDGRTMRAQFCTILELRDGKVWRQEQYDCFEPFA